MPIETPYCHALRGGRRGPPSDCGVITGAIQYRLNRMPLGRGSPPRGFRPRLRALRQPARSPRPERWLRRSDAEPQPRARCLGACVWHRDLGEVDREMRHRAGGLPSAARLRGGGREATGSSTNLLSGGRQVVGVASGSAVRPAWSCRRVPGRPLLRGWGLVRPALPSGRWLRGSR